MSAIASRSPLICLLRLYVKAGMVQEGLKAFREMEKLGFVLNVVALNHLLDGLLKSNCTDECWEIYEEMGRIGIHPNTHTFNILTHVFCKGGDVDKVNEFLEKIEEEGFDPDFMTCNTLIDSYCKVRQAHQLLHRMVHRGLTPDLMTYNTLIYGYSKEGMMHESRSLLREMVGNRICPVDFTSLILVEGYAKEGEYLIVVLCKENRPCAAKELLERMSQSGHEPKCEIYNELIYSLCMCNFIEEALLLKAEMGLCKERKLDKAESLVGLIAKEFQIYDTECCNALLKVLCEAGDAGKLMELQDRMLKKMKSPVTPNISNSFVFHNTLLSEMVFVDWSLDQSVYWAG
ncbi:hypothetical protein RHSIM_Rhsim10G0018200 [Rhododendron simsii]|uniref:Pentatricopeptide repeat-containing protein n=1 Tax=Rhododendron simsii TaxID=118357 RepID=A0A834LB29_RHOSS|nr:hypothetical protein RHSIM_Rhsim10G0018200 [Rhododendron simsii]